ncbi:Rnf-Nqr domain containing protein, partial [Eubacterium aggregans]
MNLLIIVFSLIFTNNYNLLIIVVSGIFVNNYIFSRFLGICPFLGVS